MKGFDLAMGGESANGRCDGGVRRSVIKMLVKQLRYGHGNASLLSNPALLGP